MDTRTDPATAWHRLRARPLLLGGLVVAALVAVGVVLVWFQPQALLFDTVVDEAFPTVAPREATDAGGRAADDAAEADAAVDAADQVDDEPGEPPAPTGPVALATGSFESRNRYTVTGEATYYELPDGSRTLRLEGFESTNGPDLYVYLTVADSGASDAVIDDDVVDLGLLTGNVGAQNYLIPPEVDLDRYDTVVIWCRRFAVGFGAADLRPS
jgi:hypothetical protein